MRPSTLHRARTASASATTEAAAVRSTPAAKEADRVTPNAVPGKDKTLLADQAHDAIIDLILSYRLRMGERTSVVQLAERLSLGRTPVKEAIARLEAEGLLAVSGRSGTTVKEIDATTARQLFALRRTLEAFAVDDAIRLVTRAELDELRQLLAGLRWRNDAPGLHQAAASFVRNNVRFHAAIVACARNPTLDRLYAQVQLQAQIVSYIYRLTESHKDQAMIDRYQQHKAIYQALEARDAETLRRLLEEHSATTEAAVLASLQDR
jgi:DNA-binding GntR family transcriptional regulator